MSLQVWCEVVTRPACKTMSFLRFALVLNLSDKAGAEPGFSEGGEKVLAGEQTSLDLGASGSGGKPSQ